MSQVSGSKAPLRAIYLRYADDWIVVTNANRELAEEIKNRTSEWLETNLKSKPSEEKASTTNIEEQPARSLGFSLKSTKQGRELKTYTDKDGRIIKRRAERGSFIGVDSERVIKRVQTGSFITRGPKIKPKRNALTQQLQPHRIVQKYSEIINGVFNYYYKNITQGSDLGRYHYLMYSSCLHTIAARRRRSILSVTFQYGRNIKTPYREVRIVEGNKTEIPKYISFPLTKELRRRNERIKNTFKKKKLLEKTTNEAEKTLIETKLAELGKKVVYKDVIENKIDYKVDMRTRVRMEKFCAICNKNAEETSGLESHHIKPLKKLKNSKMKEFEKMIRNLNSLQIVVCKDCHNKIHNGTMDTLNKEKLSKVKRLIRESNLVINEK